MEVDLPPEKSGEVQKKGWDELWKRKVTPKKMPRAAKRRTKKEKQAENARTGSKLTSWLKEGVGKDKEIGGETPASKAKIRQISKIFEKDDDEKDHLEERK